MRRLGCKHSHREKKFGGKKVSHAIVHKMGKKRGGFMAVRAPTANQVQAS